MPTSFTHVYNDPANNAALSNKGYNSSHMSGRVPAGGNILFLDGHVEWRKFKNMKWLVSWTSSRWFWL